MFLQIIIHVISVHLLDSGYASVAKESFDNSPIEDDINIYNFQIDNILNEKLIPVSMVQHELQKLLSFTDSLPVNDTIDDNELKDPFKELGKVTGNDLASAIKVMVFYR